MKTTAWILLCLLVIAGLLYAGHLSDEGKLLGFDGMLQEPGCDLGNPRCEPEDIISSCRYEKDPVVVRVYCRHLLESSR